MTAEGLEAITAEVEELETGGRDAIARQIKTAREWGDLKENAEYHAAKEAQAHLETKIKTLRQRIKYAEVIEADARQAGVVSFGSTVQVHDPATDRTSTFRLVASHEADLKQGLLSVESPMAGALRGKRVGDVATVATPRGERRLTVVEVS